MSGVIVSEMPLSHRPLRGLFPARNRIISGLGLGTLVIEGADASGSLITARMAADQGREVFAVPGSIINPYSKGPHRLLKAGAVLTENGTDILEALGFSGKQKQSAASVTNLSEGEQRILGILTNNPVHINAIGKLTSLTIAGVAAILTVLEMKGIIKDYGDKMYGLVC